MTKILVRSESTEQILHTLEQFFPGDEHLRIVIISVEATIPRPPEPEIQEEKTEQKSQKRISIEELYQKLFAVSFIDTKYVVMVVIASVVAAIGLLKNDVAVIIGSMVIAPLFSPNIALSLATTLADLRLAKKNNYHEHEV